MNTKHLFGILCASVMATAMNVASAEASGDWTGAYVGGYLGGVFGSTPGSRIPDGIVLRPDPSGFTAGGIAGAEFELADPFVVGVEGDIGYMSSDGRATGVSFGTGSNGHTYTDRTQLPSIFRVRGILGYDCDQYLFFLAGGGSFANRSVTFIDLTTGTDTVKIHQSPSGWNIGGGMDYAFSDHFVGRVEYIYDALDRQTYGFVGIDSDIASRNVVTTLNTVRVSLMWQF